MEEHFHGKGCVVTGAASGIGLAVSELLLKAGATVFMADRDGKTLASEIERLGELAGKAHPAIVDVTIQSQVQHVIEDAAARHGRLDFLFNNAGVGYTRPIASATLDHWRQLIDVNLWSVIYGVHAAIPIMRKQGGGHIVNTASMAGLVPLPFQALYCTTKYAVVGMSESLRFELADESIHFSVVCPGDVATRIYQAGLQGEQLEGKPPDDAIPASEAARTILEGVARKEGVIVVLPEAMRQLWNQWRASPESCEELLLALARGRRLAFEPAGGS